MTLLCSAVIRRWQHTIGPAIGGSGGCSSPWLYSSFYLLWYSQSSSAALALRQYCSARIYVNFTYTEIFAPKHWVNEVEIVAVSFVLNVM